MQRLLTFLPVIITAVFVGLFVAERCLPLRKSQAALFARLLINLAFSAAAFSIALVAVRPASLSTLDWTSTKPFGLLHLVALPEWLKFGVGFLLLDLSFYYWHVLNHRLPVLWRFHNVHHIDPDFDVSTGFRFHFGEVLFSTLFRIGQVSLIGMSFPAFAAYELVFQANTLFHHSNLRLPIRMERLLNKLLVTPRMHGIHHSQIQGETNSNFGVVFSWWDKLHRTIGLNIPQSQIEIGIAGYSQTSDNRFWQALCLPFRKQRDYWRAPNGKLPKRNGSELVPSRNFLAE
jgi:sterol desaturase/sphingolipid hydroxylase (fatty acid hydroxylase superfamily)